MAAATPGTTQEASVPSSTEPAATPSAIRALVRAAVERAWADAVETGRLPGVEDGAAAPAIEIERPANPAHGDFATNLAMKLARPRRCWSQEPPRSFPRPWS